MAKISTSDKLLMTLVLIASVSLVAVIVMATRRAARSAQTPDSVAVVHTSDAAPDEPPPVLVTLPEFSLTERSGHEVSLEDLRGKVWIANFIFTRCAGPCPMVTATMAELQRRYMKWPQWGDLRLVTFSIDSQYDTPEVLAAYAKSFDADEQWLFLTGPKKEVWPLVAGGFKLTVDENPGDKASPIMHSTKFVLVDAQGRIRGYYDRDDEEDLQRLDRELMHVLAEVSATSDADKAPEVSAPAPTTP